MKIIRKNPKRTFETALFELSRFFFTEQSHKMAIASYLELGFSVELSVIRNNDLLLVEDWYTLNRTGKLISNM